MDPAAPAAAARQRQRPQPSSVVPSPNWATCLRDLVGEAEGAALGERSAALEAMGLPPGIARRAAALATLSAAGDLALAAEATNCSIGNTARLYFRLGERLSLALLANAAQKLPREGLWPSQAALAMQDELVGAPCRPAALGPARRAAATTAIPTRRSPRGANSRKLALERVDRLLKDDIADGKARSTSPCCRSPPPSCAPWSRLDLAHLSIQMQGCPGRMARDVSFSKIVIPSIARDL